MCLHQFASAHFLSQISCHFLLLECLPSPSPSCLPTFWAHLTASHQKVPCCFTLFHSVSSVIFPVNLLTFQGLLGKTGPPLPSLSVASSSKLSEVCLKLCLRASFALIVIFWIFLFCPAASTEQSCLSPGRTKLQKILTEMNVCHFFFFFFMTSLQSTKASDFPSCFSVARVLVATAPREHAQYLSCSWALLLFKGPTLHFNFTAPNGQQLQDFRKRKDTGLSLYFKLSYRSTT